MPGPSRPWRLLGTPHLHRTGPGTNIMSKCGRQLSPKWFPLLLLCTWCAYLTKRTTQCTHIRTTNQTQVPTNKSGAVAQTLPLNKITSDHNQPEIRYDIEHTQPEIRYDMEPFNKAKQMEPFNKALASKNITHTIEHANASRLNVTKAVERHKDQMSAKAGGISDASRAAAPKGVTAAFHSARIAAEKLRKNHLAKRANIAKEKKSTSEESFEDQQKEKIKKNVIEVEGDELAEALKGVLSFPAKVPVATTTTTTKATTTVTSTVTVATTTVATSTTLAPKVTSTHVSTEVLAKNISQGTNSTADVNSKDAKEAELKEIEAEIQKDQAEKKEAIEKDDLETALAKKKELAELEKKEAALEAQAPVSNSTTLHLFHIAANKTTKSHAKQALKSPLNAARIAASKLRGSRD